MAFDANDPVEPPPTPRSANWQARRVLNPRHGGSFADDVVVLKDGRLVGRLEPKGCEDAALVATGYQELAG